MNLYDCLERREPLKVAVVGGGGKTTSVFQLAHQVAGKAWVTATTHLGTDQLHLADQHFTLTKETEYDPGRWLMQKVTLLTGERTPDDRVRGLDFEQLDQIAKLAAREHISLMIEADGARSHPLKAPAEHEPVIPAWVETVIIVVGLSVIGKPLGTDWVHRPEVFARLTGLQPGQPVGFESVVKMLGHPMGGMKGIPAQSQKVVLFNQLDTHPLTDIEIRQLQSLFSTFDLILAGSLAFDPDHIQIIAGKAFSA